MKFASVRVAEEWKHSIDPRLRGIIEDAQDVALTLYSWPFVLTSILRTPEENDALYGGHGTHRDGVHVHGRGCDVRTRDIDRVSVKGIAGFVNTKYLYDPARPSLKVAVIEDGITAGSAAHLHFQVHDHTTTRYTKEG